MPGPCEHSHRLGRDRLVCEQARIAVLWVNPYTVGISALGFVEFFPGHLLLLVILFQIHYPIACALRGSHHLGITSSLWLLPNTCHSAALHCKFPLPSHLTSTQPVTTATYLCQSPRSYLPQLWGKYINQGQIKDSQCTALHAKQMHTCPFFLSMSMTPQILPVHTPGSPFQSASVTRASSSSPSDQATVGRSPSSLPPLCACSLDFHHS